MTPKKLVVCLDGTGQWIGSSALPTNAAKIFQMLDLSDPDRQQGYYDPGVGALPSSTVRGRLVQTASRALELGLGFGMRANLSQAYGWLMAHYRPGDDLYVFGFSRGAFTARALVGMLARPGLMRPGLDNLLDYAIREYATNTKVAEEPHARKRGIQAFSDSFCWGTEADPLFPDGWRDPGFHEDWHCVPVRYLGLWDTVKATGPIGLSEMRWPYTHHLFNAERIRHAVSIDEYRRPYREYLVHPRDGVEEVWFAGVHSDVGGTFGDDARLASISMKWVADGAVGDLDLRPGAYAASCQVQPDFWRGQVHRMGRAWDAVGRRHRVVPDGAVVHSSVRARTAQDPAYRPRLPARCSWSDDDWYATAGLS